MLIGSGLVSDRPYQLKVGNAEVNISREMTADEQQQIYDALLSGVFRT